MGRPDFESLQFPASFANVEVPTPGIEGLSESDILAFDDLARRSMQEVAPILAAAGRKSAVQEPTTKVDFDLDRANDDGMNLGRDLVSSASQEEGEL